MRFSFVVIACALASALTLAALTRTYGGAANASRTIRLTDSTAKNSKDSFVADTRTLVADARTLGDRDQDGLPDSAELISYTDRENFRRWFTRIAEGQFYRMSDAWHTEQRDCAGLVRFSLREALRRHDRLWLRRIGAEYEPATPDVRRFTLENNLLGEKLFRTRSGVFAESNLADDTFSEFADARTLRAFNTEFISRDWREAQAGDLLFFHQPWGARFPYHVMIFLGSAQVTEDAAEQGDDWVVYHTGASASDAGAVKKIRLATLARHPDARWRPVASNPRFLGFYRLKFLM